MRKRNKIILTVLAVLVLAIAGAAPFLWRTAVLSWQKSSALRLFAKISPEERRTLNATPITILLPGATDDAAPLETIHFGSLIFHLPHPDSREQVHKSLVLTYSHFKLTILPPASNPIAAPSRDFHFKNAFEMEAAVYAARLDDINLQPDLPSLKRHLMLLALKPNAPHSLDDAEQFERPDLRGFIIGPSSRRIAQIYLPSTDDICGLHFTTENKDPVNIAHIHAFLQQLRVEPNPTKSPPPTSSLSDLNPIPGTSNE